MTAEGVKHLYDDGISFITRCPTNRDIYKQALATGLADLEQPENLAVDESGRLFNGRQVYVKCVPIDLGGMKLYAYVGRDKSMQEQERRRVISEEARSKKPLSMGYSYSFRRGESGQTSSCASTTCGRILSRFLMFPKTMLHSSP